MRLRLRRLLPLVAPLALLAGGGRAADAPAFKPARVGGGPLLFFVHPEDVNGQREEVLYLHDPTAGTAPTAVWRGNPPIPAPVARPGRDLVLMQRGDLAFLLRPSSGDVRPLLKDRSAEVMTAEGAAVYFREQTNEDRKLGFELKRVGGEYHVVSYPRPEYALWQLRADDPAPARRLAAVR